MAQSACKSCWVSEKKTLWHKHALSCEHAHWGVCVSRLRTLSAYALCGAAGA